MRQHSILPVSSITDSCTFGDFKGLLSSGQTCAEMVHDSPWLCYRQSENDKCCASCERIADDNDQGISLICLIHIYVPY